MFQNIVEFVIKFKEYITFTALVVICLSLISIGNVSEIGGFRASMIVFTAWLQRSVSWIPNPKAIQNENKAIRELNLQLSQEVIKMRAAVAENDRLRKMLNFKDKSVPELIPTEVLGKSAIELRNFLTLNKGRNNGIKRGMAVRTDAGLVGLIIGVSDNYSIVEAINNRNIKVSAKIERTGITGIFTWSGGLYFSLKNIPSSFDVKKGDIVLSSGFSNRYPENVPLGEIIRVEEDNSNVFLRIDIKPFANLESIEECFVINELPDPERLKLIEQMEEIIKEKKSSK